MNKTAPPKGPHLQGTELKVFNTFLLDPDVRKVSQCVGLTSAVSLTRRLR